MSRTTVVFDAGSDGSATVPGPRNRTRIDPLPQHVFQRTANGTAVVYKQTSTRLDEWSMTLEDLSNAQRDALDDLFWAIGGPAGTFDYTHTDSTTYSNCRFVTPVLQWERMSSQLWTVQIRIEVPNGVTG